MIASMSVTKKGTQKSYADAAELGAFDVRTHEFDWKFLD